MEVINLNIIPGKAQPVVHASQYDVGRVIRCNLFEGAEVFYLDGTETISCNIKKPDNNIVTLSVTNTNDSYVEITTTEQATACDGSNLCEISITKGDDVIGSLNFIMEVECSPIEGGISSASEINNLWTQVDGMVADALATQYDSANVVFDNLPTEGHGIPYTVTSEGIGNAIDNALDMTAEASGAIATFESEYALPLRNLEIEINAVQESGTPTPQDSKAISGFTGANVAVKGANLFSLTKDTIQTDRQASLSNCTKTDTSVTATSTANNYACFGRYIFLPKGKYTIKFQATSSDVGYTPTITIYRDGNKVVITNTQPNTPTTFTLTDDKLLEVRMFVTYTNDPNIRTVTFSDIQIEKDNSVSTTYPPYVSTIVPISWQSEAGTVYGGSLDVTSGVLTVTHSIIDLGDLSWTYDSAYTRFASSISGGKSYGTAVRTAPFICTCYQTISDGRPLAQVPNNSIYNGNSNSVYIKTSDYTDAGQFTTAVTGEKLVYELATPVTYQLTPTQISAIVGTNNVFTDTNGDTSLEYYTKRGEQTVRIAEGVAVDVINNKSIDTLATTDKTVKGAINELETKKANGWAFVNETLGNADINLPTGWKEILAVCRYGNGGVLQPQAVSIVITPEQKGLYMTAGASTILAQVVVSADTTKVNMTYFGVSGTEYTSDSQIRVWYR